MAAKDFLVQLPALWKLYKAETEKQKAKAKILASGPTEEFVRELIAQAEPGIELRLEFPGGASLVVNRKAQSVESSVNGLKLREEYLDR